MQVETIIKQRKAPIIISQYVPLFPASTKSCALLDKFEKQENSGKEMRQKIIKNKAIEEILSRFKEIANGRGGDNESYYCEYLAIASKIKYSANDLEALPVLLAGIPRHSLFSAVGGYFLSAFINSCEEPGFIMRVGHLDFQFNALGYKNAKNLAIIGDVRECVGWYMEGGELAVHGNASNHAGERMSGGMLVIHGNTGDFAGVCMQAGNLVINGNTGKMAGWTMQGGTLTVNGHAGDCVGEMMEGGIIIINGNVGMNLGGADSEHSMTGGKIIVNGNIGSLCGHIRGGDIFQFDRQLVKDGRLIALPENK